MKRRNIKRRWPTLEKLNVLALLFLLIGSLSCGNEKRVELKTNSAPTISRVNILPENPSKENKLNLLIQSQDLERDPVVYYCQWLRNNEEIFGEDQDTLKSDNLRKGDLIQVKVTPFDGKANGEPFFSSAVQILDSPPTVQEVRIEPKVPYANDNLKVFVKGSDPDGDLITYNYQWEKKGIILSEERKDVLERGQFKKGDWVAVTVIPDDGEKTGSPKKSAPVMIANSPPIITSSPSDKMNGNIYTYEVMANDPDDDPVTFSLKTGPKGMEINKETGLLRWEIGKEDNGKHLIEVEASDSEGAKSIQKYTLSIEFR